MENLLLYSILFLSSFLIFFAVTGKKWASNLTNFLFADRSLKTLTSGLAINSHWLWAIALFLGPAVAYNWGIVGLLWFVIPNALSLVIVGWLITKVRDRYPNGFSLSQYVKENFSTRVSALFQLEMIVMALAALLLAFTAISKLWGFANLSSVMDPTYVSLIVAFITLLFTVRGGIRTSVFTGAVQSVLWILFFAAAGFTLIGSDLPVYGFGKNDLHTIFDFKFLTSFAVAYLIAITVSATSHGHLWQKGFSMPKESVLPSFSIAAVLFFLIVGTLLSLASFAQVNALTVANPQVAALTSISTLMGAGAILYFSIVFIGQTSTVIDSALNYFSSLVSMEWLKTDNVLTTRIIMVLFVLFAWLVSWMQLEIWTIMILMSSVRTAMFIPLILHAFNFKMEEKTIFYTSVITIVISVYFAVSSKINNIAIDNMYSMLVAIGLPLTVYLGTKLISKK
jgi:Na+/proline symporter